MVSSCGDDDDSIVVTDVDSGSEIEVASGDSFEVRLESSPSTGFAWDVDAMSSPGLVELRSKSFEEPVDGDVVGAPGTDVFVFEATGEGAGILRLAYVRSFDDPPVPERVAEYIIRIDGAPWPPDDPGEPPGTSTATAGAIEVGALLAGDAVEDVTVAGFVVWDDTTARLCEVLAESFPPQCGGAAVEITNPDALGLTLEEAQGVRWTQGRAEIVGDYDGSTLTVTG
jgi:predicted secreted protein